MNQLRRSLLVAVTLLALGFQQLASRSQDQVFAKPCRDDQDCSQDDQNREPTPRPEPTLGSTPSTGTSSCPTQPNPGLRGFADIHNHQFANLAFGGKVVVGEPYGEMTGALSSYTDTENHGWNHTGDWMGGLLATRDVKEIYYGNEGWPNFTGWPSFFEVNHQKVYQDWLCRAVQGGLRLMVVFAVDGPPLCKKVNTDGRNCDDEMSTIDLQIDAAYKMQEYIDGQSGGSGLGWYRIVRTPTEARQVIREGKLAVVLGIETAHLFNCIGENCSWGGYLDYFLGKGVIHFFPIHQANNGFGGASYFQPYIQRQSNWLGDQWKRILDPYELYTFPCPQYARGRCNVLGLTETGKSLVQELMRAGAMIDVDHMSDRAFADTLSIADAYGYPVVASHAGFNDVNSGDQDHEGQLTSAELLHIRDLGGMVGLISGQGDLNEVHYKAQTAGTKIEHVCGRTTETFAQAYYYAFYRGAGIPIALGTDFNGPLGQPGPRFGPDQCFSFPPDRQKNRDWSQQKSEKQLEYPFLASGSQTRLDKYKFGNRTFDFNTDGLAHIGLLPDFFADLEVLGMSGLELEPMFRSAEGYVQVWERAIEASGRVPKRMDVSLSPNRLPTDRLVSFTFTATDHYSKSPVTAEVYHNDTLVGMTGQVISRTFPHLCSRRCYVDPQAGGRVCESRATTPSFEVRLSAPGYLDARFPLYFDLSDEALDDVIC